MYMGLHVTWPSLSDINETLIFPIDFRKKLKHQFYKNPSSGSRFVPRRRTGRHDETESLFAIWRMRLKRWAFRG
jgi:hypothetical protein